jgi:hypothetical protein
MISPVQTISTSREQRRQSVIEMLETALEDAKREGWDWCVLVADHEKGIARRWSAHARVLDVIGALEDAKFEILTQRAQTEVNRD